MSRQKKKEILVLLVSAAMIVAFLKILGIDALWHSSKTNSQQSRNEPSSETSSSPTPTKIENAAQPVLSQDKTSLPDRVGEPHFFTFDRSYKSVKVLTASSFSSESERNDVQQVFPNGTIQLIGQLLDSKGCGANICIIREFEIRRIDLNDDGQPEYLVGVKDARIGPDGVLLRTEGGWKNLLTGFSGTVFVDKIKTNGFHNLAVIRDKEDTFYSITRLVWSGSGYQPLSTNKEVLEFSYDKRWHSRDRITELEATNSTEGQVSFAEEAPPIMKQPQRSFGEGIPSCMDVAQSSPGASPPCFPKIIENDKAFDVLRRAEEISYHWYVFGSEKDWQAMSYRDKWTLLALVVSAIQSLHDANSDVHFVVTPANDLDKSLLSLGPSWPQEKVVHLNGLLTDFSSIPLTPKVSVIGLPGPLSRLILPAELPAYGLISGRAVRPRWGSGSHRNISKERGQTCGE